MIYKYQPWFISPLSAVGLGRCGHSDHTQVQTKTIALRAFRGGGLVPNELWSCSFLVWKSSELHPTPPAGELTGLSYS